MDVAYWLAHPPMCSYEQIARELGCAPRDDSPEGWRRVTERMLKLPRDSRQRLVEQYAWAIPCEEALAALAEHAPIVEMGAGLGYWTSLLRDRGADVIAFDKHSGKRKPPPTWTTYERARGPRRPWTDVRCGEPAVLRDHADRSLLLCWPPYNTPMASECLDHWHGQTLIYIGEGPSGCTADDAFHEQLAAHFELVRTVDIPQWPGIHDELTVWRRKPHRQRPDDDEHAVASVESA